MSAAPFSPPDPPRIGEHTLVARITRFSALRGAERALLPSVRRRRMLPTTLLGTNLLVRLQRLLELRGRRGDAAIREGDSRQQLAEIDAALERFADQLHDLAEQTPVMQLRSTLPAVLARSRHEVVSLLDLHIERLGPHVEGAMPHWIDFLITLLARQPTLGATMLRVDPAAVSPAVMRLCDRISGREGTRARELAQGFRDAAIELLGLDDLADTIERMRGVKAGLGELLFDRDVLRAMVAYNIAAENRFRTLIELESEQDQALERTLHALEQLDAGAPARGRNGPGPAEFHALLQAEDLAADALTRAAFVVGLALRDLPTLAARLAQQGVAFPHVRNDWVRELNEALEAAIQSLHLAGRTGQASELARARMKYLSRP